MNFDITLNMRQAIECCAQVKRLKYLNQNIFLHITHNNPYQICIKIPAIMPFGIFFLDVLTKSIFPNFGSLAILDFLWHIFQSII